MRASKIRAPIGHTIPVMILIMADKAVISSMGVSPFQFFTIIPRKKYFVNLFLKRCLRSEKPMVKCIYQKNKGGIRHVYSNWH